MQRGATEQIPSCQEPPEFLKASLGSERPRKCGSHCRGTCPHYCACLLSSFGPTFDPRRLITEALLSYSTSISPCCRSNVSRIHRAFRFLQPIARPDSLPRAWGSMELRGKLRYRVCAPAVFSWESARGNRFQGEGLTRDISLSGAFLFSPTCPPVDEPIQLDIFLSLLDGSPSRVQIQAQACVVRVEHCCLPDSGESGFAVSTADFDFVTPLIDDADASVSLAEELEQVRETLAD